MEYFRLLLPLTERMVIIWFAAYVFSQSALFWNIIKDSVSKRDKLVVILFFSMLSIAGTYLGIPIEQGAIANIRPLGAIVAGIIGGPGVGAAVGLISGLHRWSLGGITGFACGVATVAEGLSGAAARRISGNNFLSMKTAVLAGLLGETLQVLLVLLLTRPFGDALAIERAVGLPMVVVNTVGVVGFMLIVRDVYQKYSGVFISQFSRFVEIEKKLSSGVRDDFSAATAEDVLSALTGHTDLKGIFFSQGGRVLGFRGAQAEVEEIVRSLEAMKVLDGPHTVEYSGFSRPVRYYCVPVYGAAPSQQLVLGVQVFGRSYYDGFAMRFSEGLAGLIQNQLRTYRLMQSEHEMSLAQLVALKAQIRPHFLFNALSTISSFCRTDPMKARELILDLSSYFRKTIESDSDLILLKEELELVEAYLRIEEARMGSRLSVTIDIQGSALEVRIPTLILQPLVENAVKYGVAPNPKGGRIWIRAWVEEGRLWATVEDEGWVLGEDKESQGCGIALGNIRQRLMLIYGEDAVLELNKRVPTGTEARVMLPVRQEVV